MSADRGDGGDRGDRDGSRTRAEESLVEQRSQLEKKANMMRARLLRTIDALDERRHQIAEVGHYAKRFAMPVAVGFVGVAALVAGATFGLRSLAKRRRERQLGYRIGEALVPVRRALLGEKRPTMAQEALRRVAVSAITIVAAELTKRAAKNVFDGRLPGGRPLPLPPPGLPRVVSVDANGSAHRGALFPSTGES